MVEDDRTTSRALRAIFDRRGWAVTLASTVAEALPLLREAAPACVILDLMLPDRSGLTILQHIRAERLPIRVAVTTGSSDPELLRAVVDLKPEVFLCKPIDLNDLLRGLGVAS